MKRISKARILSGFAAVLLMVIGLVIALESGASADPPQTQNSGSGLQFEHLGF
jgi:hypothetical protein